jgi:hypothetical protein
MNKRYIFWILAVLCFLAIVILAINSSCAQGPYVTVNNTMGTEPQVTNPPQAALPAEPAKAPEPFNAIKYWCIVGSGVVGAILVSALGVILFRKFTTARA